MITAGDLTCLRLRARYWPYLTYRSGMEPHRVLPLVSSDTDILVICVDEGSYEETSERTSAILGGDRTGSLQETFADPPKCDYDELEDCW